MEERFLFVVEDIVLLIDVTFSSLVRSACRLSLFWRSEGPGRVCSILLYPCIFRVNFFMTYKNMIIDLKRKL